MNKLSGIITDIEVCENLSLVKVKTGGVTLSSILIETPSSVDYLVKEEEINVLFKETEVIIALNGDSQISLQNQLPCRIKDIKQGKLLSRIILEFNSEEIRSIITSNAVNNLGIKEGMDIVAMIKTNEMMLAK